MTIEAFFEKFDLFANAPDAVAMMRDLVLELAVRGQLCERELGDSNDPTWRAFLADFDSRAEASDACPPPPPFVIPEAWRWVCLDDLGTTKVRNDVENSTRVSFVPMALISSKYGVPAQSEERTWDEVKKGFTHFANGDVVMAKITPCFENAKSAVMRNLINGVGAGTTELHVFRKTVGIILPDYVLLYIKTRGFIARGESRMTGSAGQKRVPRDYFAGSPFPLPPFAEQKRIVAKVDELMALCDRLEAQQQERETRHAALARASLARFAAAPTVSNLQFLFHESYAISPAELRKSILTLAVQGRLVPQDPNDEPAEAMLKRILPRGSNGKLHSYTSQDDDHRKLPFDLPNGWSDSRLDSLLDSARGISYGVIKLGPEPQQDGVFILRCSNVRFRRIDLHGVRKITEQLSSEYGRTILRGGEVLINVRGTLGGCAVVPPELKGYNIAREVAVIPVHEELDSSFLLNVIASPFFQDRVDENLRGIAYEGLNLGLLRDFPIPLPPLAEQRRIVAKVNELMALVDGLETQLTSARTTATALLNAAVAELTGGPSTGKRSAPSGSGTGRRGRPRKS